MSLDLTKVAAQVGALIAGLKDNRAVREQRLRFALDTLSGSAIDLGRFEEKNRRRQDHLAGGRNHRWAE